MNAQNQLIQKEAQEIKRILEMVIESKTHKQSEILTHQKLVQKGGPPQLTSWQYYPKSSSLANIIQELNCSIMLI
ncbi:MAG: hypothetical protein OMM_11923 [Candidatus Magnetoglobus multicellularis str. Araruama]|uniref:Uncharacterized protein n=1 Tax=Candidatus Magnetoglobus multicellularis str. Araruama TaxID=890399 RepID=A0A1V1NX40_9BACT|nr:MAG: hypothetical protein OMM_11923 [Candidatus Magnetoglobus multicellularis str. Araruama]